MLIERISSYVGLAGVAENENDKAKLVGRLFGMVIIAAVILLALQWHFEMKGQLSEETSMILNFTVWIFFIVETLLISALVKHKLRYLMSNWMNLFIIVVGSLMLLSEYEPLVSLLRSVRIIFALSLFIPSLTYLMRFLTDSRLSTTLVASAVILILSGVLMTTIDPGVRSIEEGIWWALVTITTVGYGDVVPLTTEGRLFSAVLILVGLGLFSVITANFAAIFIQERVDKVREEQEKEGERLSQMSKDIDHVMADDDEIIVILKDIQARLDRLENNRDK